MLTKSNLHTHSTYCDGKSTLQEMIEKALSLGFRSLGFSSHSYTGLVFDQSTLSKTGYNEYYSELLTLREKYKDKINIFIGTELEGFHPIVPPGTDFMIGSVHYFDTPGGAVSIDDTAEKLKKGIAELDNNPLNMVKNYINRLIWFSQNYNFDILGHLDLFTKFNEKEQIIDTEDSEYRSLILSATDIINSAGKIFEVNTGAVGRGYRTTPYPESFILEHLFSKNAPIIISSDAHAADKLACNFEETEYMLHLIGFRKQMELTKHGFVEVPL